MDPSNLREIMELVGSIGAPAVTVLLGMKYAINGMRQDVKDIKTDVKGLVATVNQHTVDIAVLKETVDS